MRTELVVRKQQRRKGFRKTVRAKCLGIFVGEDCSEKCFLDG